MTQYCISQGEGLLRYPDEVVTIGKKYKFHTDFELRGVNLFIGDDGKEYKVILGYFSKIKPKE